MNNVTITITPTTYPLYLTPSSLSLEFSIVNNTSTKWNLFSTTGGYYIYSSDNNYIKYNPSGSETVVVTKKTGNTYNNGNPTVFTLQEV